MPASAPFTGSIDMWSADWAPQGWALCNGQLMKISSYTDLYTLFGCKFGGDNVRTFALPDLRGRAAVGMGQSPRIDGQVEPPAIYTLLQKGGDEMVKMQLNQIPMHIHTFTADKFRPKASSSPSAGASYNPVDKFPAAAPDGVLLYASGTPDVKMAYPQYEPDKEHPDTTKPDPKAKDNGINFGVGYAGEANAGEVKNFSVVQPYLTVNYIIALNGIYPTKE